MNAPITIPRVSMSHDTHLRSLYGSDIVDAINNHNARIFRAWAERGSACKPFTPSTVPASPVDQFSVPVTAEHGGFTQKAS